ncbi:phosphoinositide 5-phosphatase [Balamuthia mandrillaris]
MFNKPTAEHALFVWKLPELQLAEVVPIFEDMVLVKTSELALQLYYHSRLEMYSFDALTPEAAGNLRSNLKRAIKNAQKERHSYREYAHHWIQAYHLPQEAKQKEREEAYNGEDEYDASLSEQGGQLGEQLSAHNPFVTFTSQHNSGEYDPSKFLSVKEMWVSGQMKARESEFTETKSMRFMFGTWNVNGKEPDQSLDRWLLCENEPPDLVAIGFQELDLSAEALILGDKKKSQKATPWELEIMNSISKMGNYSLVASKQLVGILLLLYVKQEHVPFIKDLQIGSAAVGIMGMMGNKGGVAVRLAFHDSTFCIVNTHLNAHFENVQRRNQDHKDICRRLLFPDMTDIFSTDHLFWLGDLNYRIIGTNVEVRQKIQEQDWAWLYERDQLHLQMLARKAFEDFEEGPLLFAPTYKYDSNSTFYDSSEKKRIPAWCDRVLWKSSRGPDQVKLISYSRHELLSSDHRPVTALVDVQVKSVIASKRSQVYQDVVKKLDKMENECMPDATISSHKFVFENVRVLVPCEQTLCIENTSKVVIRFRFIPKPDQVKICKGWLNINPPFGMILPGEHIYVKLSVHVDEEWAPDFNFGREKLQDILVMHLEKGKDYFIDVTGNFLPSSFGSSLEHLICFAEPVRYAEGYQSPAFSEKKRSKGLLTNLTEGLLSIPKELWRMVDYLYQNGMDEEEIFLQAGIPSEMDQIREILDTGASFDGYTGGNHSMAETLVCFLDSLVEPVVPISLYKQCLENSSSYAQCKQLLSYLPSVNYNVFYYIMAFLREVLLHRAKNKVHVEDLAVLFSGVLMRGPTRAKQSELEQQKKAEFVTHFLSLDEPLKVP